LLNKILIEGESIGRHSPDFLVNDGKKSTVLEIKTNKEACPQHIRQALEYLKIAAASLA
jgi:predicted RecB family nuclease